MLTEAFGVSTLHQTSWHQQKVFTTTVRRGTPGKFLSQTKAKNTKLCVWVEVISTGRNMLDFVTRQNFQPLDQNQYVLLTAA